MVRFSFRQSPGHKIDGRLPLRLKTSAWKPVQTLLLHCRLASCTAVEARRYAAACCGKGWKRRPLRHRACSTTASLRATATMARFLPRLPPVAASFSPQRRSSESGPKRPRTYCVDCTSRLRRKLSPALEIRRCGSVAPDWLCAGRKPRNAPAERLLAALGWPGVSTYAAATIGPTPGAVREASRLIPS